MSCLVRYLLVVLFSVHSAYGEENEQKPSSQFENGLPAIITWSDGRKASIKSFSTTTDELKLKFQIHENTCNDRAGQWCTYHLRFLSNWAFLSWDLNQDQQRVGRVVKHIDRYNNFENPLETSVTISSDFRHLYPVLGGDLSPSYITCADYSWIPSNHEVKNAGLKISTWGNEEMRFNQETGESENRTVGSATNVQFILNEKNELYLRGMDAMTSEDGELVFLLQGDNIIWSIKNSEDGLCQISLKPEPSDQRIDHELQMVEEKRRPLPQHIRDPYIVGSNELSYNTGFGSLFACFEHWASYSGVFAK